VRYPPVLIKPWRALLPLIVVVAAAIRLASSLNDLWLDEIWTLWLIAELVQDPLDIVRGFMRHDNNHLLNTFWMYCLGPHRSPVLYRLPSVICGAAAVIPAAAIGGLRGPLAGVCCAAACAIDFMLVNLGSEARGYGVTSLCVLVAQWLTLQHFDRGDISKEDVPSVAGAWRPILAFHAACVIGFLAHLSFIFCFAALVLWTFIVILTRPFHWRDTLLTMLCWHALPAGAAGCLYWFFIRDMGFGGGTSDGPVTTAFQAIAAIAGSPLVVPWQWIAVVVGGTLGLVCLVSCWRASWRRGLFFLISVLVAPAMLLVIFRVEYYSVRYFLIPAQTLLVLIASEVPSFCERLGPVSGRTLAWKTSLVALGIVFAAVNIGRDAVLVARGRGAVSATLQWIVDQSNRSTPVISCTSNQEFRSRLLVAYHGERLAGRKLRLFSDETLPPTGAEWYLANDSRDGGRGRDRIKDRWGNEYTRVHEMRSGGLSPMHWHIYKNNRSFRRPASMPPRRRLDAEGGGD
jgi:hypothetical protein